MQIKRLDGLNIEYWDIVDEPLVSRKISLPRCYKKVENLVNHHIKCQSTKYIILDQISNQ